MNPTEQQFYTILLIAGLLIGAAVFIFLHLITAPYGRHTRAGWGPTLRNPIAWTLMELPAALGFAAFFLLGAGAQVSPAWAFLLLWELHYIHRSIIYPMRIRANQKRMPMLIISFGILFNLWNTYLNGRYLGLHATEYTLDWFTGPRFLIGLLLFLLGMAINIQSDNILLRLRKKGDTHYAIPHGGLYRWITSPNYFGEIIEWIGWAILTWSIPGLIFALWTLANLLPRARSHHQWSKKNLSDYPPNRKIILPLIY